MPTLWNKSQTKLFMQTTTTSGSTNTTSWVRLGKSVVFDMSMNAQTESFEYIEDDSPTEVISYYKPQLPVEYIAAEGDSGFDALWDMFENLKTGSDAIKKFLVVFPKAGTTSSTYRAWQFDATVVMTNLTTTERKLKAELYIGGNIDHGTVSFDSSTGLPTFTEDA